MAFAVWKVISSGVVASTGETEIPAVILTKESTAGFGKTQRKSRFLDGMWKELDVLDFTPAPASVVSAR